MLNSTVTFLSQTHTSPSFTLAVGGGARRDGAGVKRMGSLLSKAASVGE